jgi:hypothetical protein
MAGYDLSADLNGKRFDAYAEFCCGEKKKPKKEGHALFFKGPWLGK